VKLDSPLVIFVSWPGPSAHRIIPCSTFRPPHILSTFFDSGHCQRLIRVSSPSAASIFALHYTRLSLFIGRGETSTSFPFSLTATQPPFLDLRFPLSFGRFRHLLSFCAFGVVNSTIMTGWFSSLVVGLAALTALVNADSSTPTCREGQNCPAEFPCCSRIQPTRHKSQTY